MLGINDDAFRERLLREPKIILETAVKFVRAAEYSKKHSQIIKSGTEKPQTVGVVKQSFSSGRRRKPIENDGEPSKNHVDVGG